MVPPPISPNRREEIHRNEDEEKTNQTEEIPRNEDEEKTNQTEEIRRNEDEDEEKTNQTEEIRRYSHDRRPPVDVELRGCGGIGKLHWVRVDFVAGDYYLLKQFKVGLIDSSSDDASTKRITALVRDLEREVNGLKNLSHENILPYKGAAWEGEMFKIFLSYCPGENLSSILPHVGCFRESAVKIYTKKLLFGLEYLHKNGIVHKDIKAENVIISGTERMKLAYFCISKKLAELVAITESKPIEDPPYWTAPEVIHQNEHSFSSDIWSFGCMVIEFATGKHPWCQYEPVEALNHIGTTESPIPEHLSAELKDFLSKCFQKEPHLRSSASELLQHPFVNGEFVDAHTGGSTMRLKDDNDGVSGCKK